MSDRIAAFIDQATSLKDDPRKAALLCKRELKALYAAYADSTVHFYLTKYRHAITAAELDTPYRQLMREPLRKMRANNTKQRKKVYQRQARQKPIYDADAIVNQALSLLEKDSYAAVAVGIALLTGRRDYEVCVTAKFQTIRGREYEVRFSGQAKTRNNKRASKPYVIPVLTTPHTILDALMHLRSLRDFTAYMPDENGESHAPKSRLFHDRTEKTLREACTRYFGKLIPQCTPHDLRKIYAVIAYDWFAPPDMSIGRYASEILGHSEGDLVTVQSYQDFYLATHPTV
jgi:hypothetical protein